jgi:GTPase SAR1 family protein
MISICLAVDEIIDRLKSLWRFVKRTIKRQWTNLKRSIKKIFHKKGSVILLLSGDLLKSIVAELFSFFDIKINTNAGDISKLSEIDVNDLENHLTDEITIYRSTERKILIVGPVGSGKSTIAKNVFKTISEIDHTVIGCTPGTEKHIGNGWIIFDTAGLGEPEDGKVPDMLALEKLVRLIRFDPDFNICLLVINESKISNFTIRIFKLIEEVIPFEIPKIVIMTKSNDNIITLQDFKKRVKEKVDRMNIRFIIQSNIRELDEIMEEDEKQMIISKNIEYTDRIITVVSSLMTQTPTFSWVGPRSLLNKLQAIILYAKDYMPDVETITLWETVAKSLDLSVGEQKSFLKALKQGNIEDAEVQNLFKNYTSIKEMNQLIEEYNRRYKVIRDEYAILKDYYMGIIR